MSAPVRHTSLYFNPNIEKNQYSAISGKKLSELKNPVYFRGDPNIYDLEEVHEQWKKYGDHGYDMYPVRTYENGAAQYDQTMNLITRAVPRNLREMPMKMYVGDLYELVSVTWNEFIGAHNHRIFSPKMIQLLKNSGVNTRGCELPPSILASAYDGAPDLDKSLQETEIFLKNIGNWDYFFPVTPEKEHFFHENVHIQNWKFNNIQLSHGQKTLNFGKDLCLQHELYASEIKHAVFTYAITLALKVPVALIQISPYTHPDTRRRFG